MNNFNSNESKATHSEKLIDIKVETRKNSRLALYLAFLALFFTTVGITVGYKHWLRIHDKAKSALVEINKIQMQLSYTAKSDKVDQLQASLTQSSSDAEQQLSKAIQELKQIHKQTMYSAKTVTDQIQEFTLQQQNNTTKSTTLKRSLKTEIRFLLETAKHRLIYNHDKISALQLLKTADQLLIQTASTDLLIAREKLAHDIAQLEQLPTLDIEKLIQEIYQLEIQIKPLAVLENEFHQNKNSTLFEVNNKDNFTGKVKDYLNHSISISKQINPPRYTLNTSDKKRTDQLLKLRFESLRLMILQRQDALYHLQIKSIKNMLDLYYSTSVSKAWLTTLNELDKQNLSPQYPSISSALNIIVKTSSTEGNL